MQNNSTEVTQDDINAVLGGNGRLDFDACTSVIVGKATEKVCTKEGKQFGKPIVSFIIKGNARAIFNELAGKDKIASISLFLNNQREGIDPFTGVEYDDPKWTVSISAETVALESIVARYKAQQA